MKHAFALLAVLPFAPLAAIHAAEFADGGSPATLRAAIRDLMNDFGARYPSRGEFRQRMDAVEKEMASGAQPGRAAFAQLQREALAIIQACQVELRQNPEADMPGFRPCAEHQAREVKYQALQKREQHRRQALADGQKIYDPGAGLRR